VRASALHGIKVDEAAVPLAIDELPVFFIAAACAEGETLVRGALELRVKESDRLAAMAAGLARLGVELELLADGVWIRGATDGFGGGSDRVARRSSHRDGVRHGGRARAWPH
jgi:5-enolpyruvylshikimate-3-phosphate synthase